MWQSLKYKLLSFWYIFWNLKQHYFYSVRAINNFACTNSFLWSNICSRFQNNTMHSFLFVLFLIFISFVSFLDNKKYKQYNKSCRIQCGTWILIGTCVHYCLFFSICIYLMLCLHVWCGTHAKYSVVCAIFQQDTTNSHDIILETIM